MKTSDFDFFLPEHLVAQMPSPQRGGSQLCVFQRESEQLHFGMFAQLPQIVRALREQSGFSKIYFVCNDSRVFPARVLVKRASRGEGLPPVSGEVFILNPLEQGPWKCLLRPQKKMRVGDILLDQASGVPLFRVESVQPPTVSLALGENDPKKIALLLESFGKMPLPPYISREEHIVAQNVEQHADKSEKTFDSNWYLDKERYQTVYASSDDLLKGSAAAPTAGLHFTPEIMQECEENGAEFLFVTLHVGLGTFSPVQTEDVFEHVMHAEYCYVSEKVARILQVCKNQKEQQTHERAAVVFVGTTSLRTVESFFRLAKTGGEWFETKLFLYPNVNSPTEPIALALGDGLLTNFHQPKSTLCMLVAALLGYANWRRVYETAIAKSMKFFSYGDSNFYLWGKLGMCSLQVNYTASESQHASKA